MLLNRVEVEGGGDGAWTVVDVCLVALSLCERARAITGLRGDARRQQASMCDGIWSIKVCLARRTWGECGESGRRRVSLRAMNRRGRSPPRLWLLGLACGLLV